MVLEKNIWSKHSSRLSGCWKCISYEVFSTTTPSVLLCKPHGDSPFGRLTLSPAGYLSTQVMYQGFYSGHLRLYEDEKGLYWQTTPEIHAKEEMIGAVEERRVEYLREGEREYLILRPVGDMALEVSFCFSCLFLQLSRFSFSWSCAC